MPIVGIGASAGGLQAFEEFFQHTPPDTGMAFVLVSHLDPDHASILHELLRKSTPMPVQQARDGMRIEANQVYVAPPGKDIAILNGGLQLMNPAPSHRLRLPIDYWLRSLAQDQGARAIGVILSGNGSDGTLGLKAIKGESGLALAQSPESARFPGMPSSAIATGVVDFVLAPREMPSRLLQYVRGPHLGQPELELGTAIPAAIQKVFVLLRARTGADFSCYKASTLRRRVERRMNIHQIKIASQYVRYLEENPQEVDLLFKELLIGVTSFFRDPEAFQALAEGPLPKLLASKAEGTPIRIWVPGCATGEEAFSLAILLREAMDRLQKHFELQIFATDLDSQAIETARAGLYPQGIASDVDKGRLRRYFSRENDDYRVKKEIRETVIFAEQNLIKNPPFTKLDIISCRNLLIYLQSDLQKRLLPLFFYALKPRGLLFLGSSETIGGFRELFEVADRKWKLFRRKDGTVATHLPVPFDAVAASDHSSKLRPVAEAGQTNLADLLPRLLADRFAPPSVVINERGDVVYVHGQTGLFLQPAPGRPSFGLVAMARPGLQMELAMALRKVVSGRSDVVARQGVRVETAGGSTETGFTIARIAVPESLRGLLVVTFESDSPPTKSSAAERPAVQRERKRKDKGTLPALERELEFTKSTLQGTIAELEISNEELKSTNEELQSTNEELQSTNEELETSKEEMQSLNEELQTVNAELQGKVEELSRVNDDMANLLNATEIATIFLDDALHIKRFTAHATDVIRLIPTDVGRPIADIVSRLQYMDLERDATEVLETLALKEAEVKSQDGTPYLMRIMPYRRLDNVIDGLVLTFVDIGMVKRAEEAVAKTRADYETEVARRQHVEATLKETESDYASLFANTRSGIAVYQPMADGHDFEVLDINPAAERIARRPKQDVVGKRVAEAFPGAEESGIVDVFRRVSRTGKTEHVLGTQYADPLITGSFESHVCRLASGKVVAVFDLSTGDEQDGNDRNPRRRGRGHGS